MLNQQRVDLVLMKANMIEFPLFAPEFRFHGDPLANSTYQWAAGAISKITNSASAPPTFSTVIGWPVSQNTSPGP